MNCYMTGENPVSGLAQLVFMNLNAYLKTGLNWPTRYIVEKSYKKHLLTSIS